MDNAVEQGTDLRCAEGRSLISHMPSQLSLEHALLKELSLLKEQMPPLVRLLKEYLVQLENVLLGAGN